ncbi:hypothetical protein [uncultured Methylobacterium sp.]|uniref:hypothetical protein n=1 Tax=uncultured Methylobacterium sp. TaxID=157278 RepID=UPI0035C9BE91
MPQTLSLSLAALGALLAVQTAQAQGYDEAPGGRGYDERPVYRERGGRPGPQRAVGLNCDAVQQGISGPKPYSCPLPDPRPLGARCFCDMPIAPFNPAQTAVGRVVP